MSSRNLEKGHRMPRIVMSVVGAGCTLAGVMLACSSFESADAPSGTVADGGAQGDTGSKVDDAGLPFCASVDASFCWSFDDSSGDLLLGPSLKTRGVRPDLTDAALSAPNAMLVDYRIGETEKAVTLDVPATTAFRCEIDIAVDALTRGAGNGVEMLTFIPPGIFTPNPSLTIQSTDGVSVESSIFFLGGTPATVPLGNIALGKWVHVTLETEIGDGGSELVRASVSGVSGTATWAPDGGVAELGPYKARLGLVNGLGAKAWTVRYDNVVCTWK